MPDKKGSRRASSIRRYLLAGLFTVIPIWITWLVIKFLLNLLKDAGGPIVVLISDAVRPYAPALADWLSNPHFQSVIAAIIIFLALYILGWVTTRVVGKRLLGLFDSIMDRIPLVSTIYGSVKQLLTSLEQKPEGVQRVVLIDFPSPEMKTVGFVTRTLVDEDTGEELAAVYVPTTPNPTSGYLEILPLDRVTSTNWTVEEAMTFIISGGAVAPKTMNYSKSAEKPEKQAP